ncbi:MAG: hypothetical protein QOJ54_763 [Aliidongia sp.]|jgi:hypothetical protein|nr:hypothetical protein [Aliidongia sp.]
MFGSGPLLIGEPTVDASRGAFACGVSDDEQAETVANNKVASAARCAIFNTVLDMKLLLGAEFRESNPIEPDWLRRAAQPKAPHVSRNLSAAGWFA